MRKQKGNSHSVAEALKYAQSLGYKYLETPPQELCIGDIVEMGLNKMKVVDVKINGASTEVTYRVIGEPIPTDNVYWENVHATESEKFSTNIQYYNEWKNRTNK